MYRLDKRLDSSGTSEDGYFPFMAIPINRPVAESRDRDGYKQLQESDPVQEECRE